MSIHASSALKRKTEAVAVVFFSRGIAYQNGQTSQNDKMQSEHF